ncbi:MAG: hypothetical protein U5R06_00950 [candidate division KSB1 bacterium]|nr:hypothetical protein [candidate division KSB1 bacterium]
MKKIISIAAGFIILLFIVYLFLFGRLFPFSPLSLGFEKTEFDRAVVYHDKNDTLAEFSDIDSLIQIVETTHRLSFRDKVDIFLPATDRRYRRYTGTGARFVVQPLYGRLFISERAQQDYRADKIHFNVYMKHELSHTLQIHFIVAYFQGGERVATGARRFTRDRQQRVMQGYEQILQQYPVDTSRIILGGPSAGGYRSMVLCKKKFSRKEILDSGPNLIIFIDIRTLNPESYRALS